MAQHSFSFLPVKVRFGMLKIKSQTKKTFVPAPFTAMLLAPPRL